jgi:hypothetical protein
VRREGRDNNDNLVGVEVGVVMMNKDWLAVAATVLFLGMVACQPQPPTKDEVAELEEVQAENVALNGAFDDIEGRLLQDRAEVGQLRLLEERHNQVSQVACQNLTDHWDGITRYLDNQDEKARRLRTHRVAQSDFVVR